VKIRLRKARHAVVASHEINVGPLLEREGERERGGREGRGEEKDRERSK